MTRRFGDRLPHALIAFRVVCAPALIAAALMQVRGRLLFAIAALALASDVLDGFFARLLGIVTPSLRYWDSVADRLVYLAAVITLFIRYPEHLRPFLLPIALVLLLDASRVAFELVKFGRIAAYHMWSSRVSGMGRILAFAELTLLDRAGLLVIASLVAMAWKDLEGLAASVILPTWRHDVPSLVHAWRLKRGTAL